MERPRLHGNDHEDGEAGDALVISAREIVAFSGEQEKERLLLEDFKNQLFGGEEKSFLLKFDKGTDAELFFQALNEEIFNMNILVENIKSKSPEKDESYVIVQSAPLKTNKKFILFLLEGHDNFLLNVLAFPLALEKNKHINIQQIEDDLLKNYERRVLSKGLSSKRIACRIYQKITSKFPTLKDDALEQKFKKVEPLSNKELKVLMRSEIARKYEDFRKKDEEEY